MLIKFFDQYSLNNERPTPEQLKKSQAEIDNFQTEGDAFEYTKNIGSLEGSAKQKEMLSYLDNTDNYMDLLIRDFKESNKIDAKAYEKIF